MNGWKPEELPGPVAFVLSGGATLGALQVGQVRALAESGFRPELVVGTSVGSLNGAVIASRGDAADAAAVLTSLWTRLEDRDVFPGSRVSQAWRIARGRSVYPDSGLRSLIDDALEDATTFADLALPLGALATDVLTSHPRVFTSGDLTTALLASAAIPGVLPMQATDEGTFWDGGLAANVPLRAAARMGAGSIVVLDVGDICHRSEIPRGVARTVTAAFGTAIRQRVLVEATVIARDLPVLYLPRPCVTQRDPLSFSGSERFIDAGYAAAAEFLVSAPLPRPGEMVGTPHDHEPSPFDAPLTIGAATTGVA